MRILVSQPMGKKGEFIRIRADAELKQALAESAKNHIRQEADEARYAHLADAHLRQAVESLTPTGGHPGQKLANSPSTKPKKPRK